jgi:hypothetical protein
VAVYNAAAAALPKFKPATTIEVRRRCQARDFDPGAWFFAEEGGQVVGYATFQKNGRVSYPWCRPGHERVTGPLFQHVLEAMQRQSHPTAFTAYRGDWAPVLRFFQDHGFKQVREMINYLLDLSEMPTPPARMSSTITPLQRQDLPAVLRMAPSVLRVNTAEALERHLLGNPYFAPEAVFALRDRVGGEPLAVGLLIEDPTYADPKLVDSAMPCFRLGAFGTEGMTHKRINGMFSLLAPEGRTVGHLGLDLVGYAAFRMQKSDLETFAGQVPSDAPHLARFYQSYFRRQGSFPIFAKALGIGH